MKFKCCQSALSSLIIGDNALSFCCWFKHAGYSFLENYNGTTDFIEKYKQARKIFIENCKNGTENYDVCFSCSKFVEQDWDEDFGIDYISLTARKKCSCNCIYCIVTNGETEKRREFNQTEIWDIKPVLEYLSQNKFLKNEGTLFIGAGECSEYPKEELQWLIDYANNNNFSLEVASSAAFYSEALKNSLTKDKILMVVSVDAGTKDTFEKVKRVKFYDNVWNNLRKYIEASINNKNADVVIKYIILDGINDDIEEFDEFINMCNKVNCQNIEISMDINFQQDKSVLTVTPTEKIKNLITHIQNLKDERIYFKSVIPIKEINTTARKYEDKIEKAILSGNTTVKIVVLSGTENTYQKLTNTDLYNNIWKNISLYSKISKNCPSFFSELYIQYEIIPGSNDSIEEIESFINKCNNLEIKHIEFAILANKKFYKNKEKLDNLKNTILYIKSLNKQSIKISNSILKLVN